MTRPLKIFHCLIRSVEKREKIVEQVLEKVNMILGSGPLDIFTGFVQFLTHFTDGEQIRNRFSYLARYSLIPVILDSYECYDEKKESQLRIGTKIALMYVT